ncbi:MAG: minor capsid protein, partial [Anaerolineales bacterium]|nr:minor capsid protein [Anaerolineales bacterium]
MASNDDLLAAIVRHQVDILRFSKGEALTALGILDAADKDLVKRIASRSANGLSSLGTSRLEEILQEVRDSRDQVFKRLKSTFNESLDGLAAHEVAFENAVLTASVPFVLDLKSVPAARLKALAKDPVRGLPLDGWLDNMQKADTDRLLQALTLAAVEGDTIDQIIQRLGPGFATTRANTEALARTAINHISNKSREEVWLANEDIIDGLRWTATLDGRTSPICQARDGQIAPVGDNPLPSGSDPLNPPGARPPAHFNCRSVMVPVIDGEAAIGDRPFIRDRRRPKERLKDFRADAKAKLGADKWKTLSEAQRAKLIASERNAWAKIHIGQVPAKTTYDQWLRKQPKAFHNEVLGPSRAKLFREGTTLDKFVDISGKTLTLEQLSLAGA